MLEILIIILVGKKVGGIAEQKGYSSILFTLLFVGCWFFGEIAGFVLGFAFLQSMGAVYGLALLLAVLGALFAFLVAALLPDRRDERFDSLGRPRLRGKRRKRRRPIEDEDDSYRERVQTRRREELDELEVIEDDEEILELEEIEEPPRKSPPRPPLRKPSTTTRPSGITKPDPKKFPPRPPQRKPNPDRDRFRPPER